MDWWRFWLATAFGVVVAVMIERITEYFTSTEKKPVKEIAAAASTGPATLIIQGFAYGLESSVWAIFAIASSLLAPLFIFPPGLYDGPMLSFYGIALTGLGLLGATVIFLLFREKAMFVLVGFGFGGSLAALFMRVGGGIYTKGADVGADLVGKVEAGIPEDDPRNPATIADNVGDNVGDCAGMAADVFESYEVTLVAAIILGVAASLVLTPESAMKLVMFALLVRGVGVIASIIGVLAVKGEDRADLNPMKPINFGFWVSAILAALGNLGVAYFFMQDIQLKSGATVDWWRFWLATAFGVVVAVMIERITEYFTSTEKKPVQEISAAASTGPATLIIQGFAYGL